MFTIHGDADPLVPYAHGVRLKAALDKAGVKNLLHTVKGGGHGGFTPEQQVAAFEAARDFLRGLGWRRRCPERLVGHKKPKMWLPPHLKQEATMPENKDSGDKSLSDIQLDDFDVNRQRERLERSRPDNLQSDRQEGSQQSAKQPPKQEDHQGRR